MAKSKSAIGLGKGLDALLPSEVLDKAAGGLDALAPDDGASVGITALIDIENISPNRLQPREDFDAEALEELKNSIKEKGVIQPITVRRVEEGYEIIAGERRFRACKANGFTSIPAYIINVDTDAEMLELALIENVQREHLNPVEVARGYQRLISECQLTQEEVAQKVGKDRSTVTNFLRLLKLGAPILNLLRDGKLSMGHARAMIGIADLAAQEAISQRIIKDELNVRKTEELVKLVESGRPVDSALDGSSGKRAPKPKSKQADNARAATNPELSNTLREIESQLRQLFGTQVRVKVKSEGGAIEIEYYSTDDLERLLDLFAIIERNEFS